MHYLIGMYWFPFYKWLMRSQCNASLQFAGSNYRKDPEGTQTGLCCWVSTAAATWAVRRTKLEPAWIAAEIRWRHSASCTLM